MPDRPKQKAAHISLKENRRKVKLKLRVVFIMKAKSMGSGKTHAHELDCHGGWTVTVGLARFSLVGICPGVALLRSQASRNEVSSIGTRLTHSAL